MVEIEGLEYRQEAREVRFKAVFGNDERVFVLQGCGPEVVEDVEGLKADVVEFLRAKGLID